jgi:hypothetical protein
MPERGERDAGVGLHFVARITCRSVQLSMRMRKPASASADGKKMRSGVPRDLATELATQTVCLALALAVIVLASRIASIW